MDLNKKHILSVMDYLLCLILSAEFAIAPSYISTGTCKYGLAFAMNLVLLFCIFVALVFIVRFILSSNVQISVDRISFITKILDYKRSILIMAAIMLVVWLPTLLMLYPGTLINDTWGQLGQYVAFTTGQGTLHDHHPVFDTIVMGLLIVPLGKASGNWQFIFFMYVLLQAFLTCVAFSYTLVYAYKKLKLDKFEILVMFLIYCFLPIYPVSVQSISKDALFGWIYILFMVEFCEIIRSRGDALGNCGFVVRIVIWAVLCCLTKKVGMYVILLSLLGVFIFQKKNRKVLLIIITSCISVMFIIMPVIKGSLNIEPGGKQEMLSLPFQMTARYVVEHRDDITDDEYAVLNQVLGMGDLAQRYEPTNADPVKGYSQRCGGRDYVKYILVWAKQGIRHPVSYWHGLQSMLAGWFSWNEYDPIMNMGWHDQLDTNKFPESAASRSGIAAITGEIYQGFYHGMYNNCLISLWFTYGLYASIIPFFIFGTVLRRWNNKEIKYFLVALPMFFSLCLGCYLAPVSINLEGRRYLYPLTYSIPITLLWCMFIYKSHKTNR